MIVTCEPSPVPPGAQYHIVVAGGVPPYAYVPAPSPPNPPGIRVTETGEVFVPPDTPPGTEITVDVRDSAEPPEEAPATNTVL